MPLVFTVTGGGQDCFGGLGVSVGLDSSQTGVHYQLQLNGANMGGQIPGTTGNAITFGNQTSAGTYTVVATYTATLCTNNMNGNAIIVINPLSVPVISGKDTVCSVRQGIYI